MKQVRKARSKDNEERRRTHDKEEIARKLRCPALLVRVLAYSTHIANISCFAYFARAQRLFHELGGAKFLRRNARRFFR